MPSLDYWFANVEYHGDTRIEVRNYGATERAALYIVVNDGDDTEKSEFKGRFETTGDALEAGREILVSRL